jgi:hypothetical protein
VKVSVQGHGWTDDVVVKCVIDIVDGRVFNYHPFDVISPNAVYYAEVSLRKQGYQPLVTHQEGLRNHAPNTNQEIRHCAADARYDLESE